MQQALWRNWSREQACIPAVRASPGSVAEVVAEVERAAAAGRVVRAAGSGHSFNDIVVTDGTLVELGAMNRVLDVDRESGLVRVEAGILLHELARELAHHGLALQNLGDVDKQSVAGAISTGTHGAGASLPNLAAPVEAITLVDGRGHVRELTGGDELRAARVALGALGIITEVTLRCMPAYTLRGHDEARPLGDVLDHLDELTSGARHFEFYVFPHTDRALTRTNTVVEADPDPPPGVRRWVEDMLLNNYAFGAACVAGRAVPRAIPAINRALARVSGSRTRVDGAHRIFVSPRVVRFVELELQLPADRARAAVEAILAVARSQPVNFPIEVRFVAGDDALISPATGRDTVAISAHNFVGLPWEPFFRAVQAIGDEHGARPHWGKRHFHTAATLRPLYPEWDTFQAIRRRFDPDGRFANAHIRRVLG